MKHVKLLFILLAVVAISCSTDAEEVITEADLTLDITTRAEILSALETTLTAEKGVSIIYEKSEVIQIDNEFYLRAWSKEYVTTTLLDKDGKGGFQSKGISCTTDSCSGSATQCVPKKGYCTQCTGDCTRTTTEDTIGG